jgi:hypothetical protein
MFSFQLHPSFNIRWREIHINTLVKTNKVSLFLIIMIVINIMPSRQCLRPRNRRFMTTLEISQRCLGMPSLVCPRTRVTVYLGAQPFVPDSHQGAKGQETRANEICTGLDDGVRE